MNEYIANAKNFLKSCNAKMSITFKRYGKHFEDDKDFRNIYTVRIDRNGKSFRETLNKWRIKKSPPRPTAKNLHYASKIRKSPYDFIHKPGFYPQKGRLIP